MELETKQERYNILISRILQNKGKTTSAIYEIGLDLKEIQERELYLLDCRDFKEFLRTRVDLERSTAYLAIEMVKSYSIKDFNKWGLAKLMMIKRQLPEKEDREEFLKTQSVESIRHTQINIQDFRLDKGLKQISRFKGQVGKPTKNEEFDFELIRQAREIIRFKEGLVESITNWLKVARNSKNEEIRAFEKEFELYLK